MSSRVKFVLNRRNFQKQILGGDGTSDMLVAHAEESKPSGESIVVVADDSNGRARVRIGDTSWRALFREAREGHLSRAIGIAAGDRKVWYTTKAGKRRLATQAQVANWTRGRRA